jgi:hypothetical protein
MTKTGNLYDPVNGKRYDGIWLNVRWQFGQHTKSYDDNAGKSAPFFPNRMIGAMENCMILVRRATVSHEYFISHKFIEFLRV